MDNKDAATKLVGMGIGVTYKRQGSKSLDTYELFPESNDMFKIKTFIDEVPQTQTFPFVQGNEQYKKIALDTAVARFFELTFPSKTR